MIRESDESAVLIFFREEIAGIKYQVNWAPGDQGTEQWILLCQHNDQL